MKTLVLLSLLFSSALLRAAGALTAEEQTQVIENAARLIEERYVNPDSARTIASELRNAKAQWAHVTEPAAFAREVTEWLRATSGDGHLGLSYSEKALSKEDGGSGFSAAETEKYYGAHLNHGVEKIERLPGNIILVDLRVFPPAAMAGDVFGAAMTVAAQGDALILDLRQNGGGADTSANLLVGYLLDGGKPLSGTYDRPTNIHSANTSPVWVPGRRFGSTKPLYILTSRKTFSAAEAVAYDLQALKRATIVGEVTGGGAHPFEYRRVHPHFAVDLPEGRSINPITGSNWQDVGVKPDVAVRAEQALAKALEIARAAIARKQ
ncbi:MAG TPA: S41 family peptidase [Chthoniobacterales bacterium]|nr:S41 family peptidase [Chthoniobacterales bacterium]